MEGRISLTSTVLPLLVFILVHSLIASGDPLEDKSESLSVTSSTSVGDSSPTSPTALSQQTMKSLSYNTMIIATNTPLVSTSPSIKPSSELPLSTNPIPVLKSNDSSNLTHGDGSLKAERNILFSKITSTTVSSDIHLPAGTGKSRIGKEESGRVNKHGSGNSTSRKERLPVPSPTHTDKKSNFEYEIGETLKPHFEVTTTSPPYKFETDEPKQVDHNAANRGEGAMILWCANYIALFMLTCMMY